MFCSSGRFGVRVNNDNDLIRVIFIERAVRREVKKREVGEQGVMERS